MSDTAQRNGRGAEPDAEEGRIRFSVVIPLYNKRNTIARCLSSVERNDPDLIREIVVVNDGSTDGGERIVRDRAAENPKIRLICQPNQGVSAARNAGIAASRSDRLLLLDADDEWLPDFASTIAGLVARCPEAILFATAYRFRWANATESRPRYCFVPFDPGGGYIENYLRCIAAADPPVCSSCVGFTKAAFEAAGGFPVGISHGEDKIFWLRMVRQGRFAWTPEVEALRHESPADNSAATWSPARSGHYLAEIGRTLSGCGEPDRAAYLRRLYAKELGQFGRAAARGRHVRVALGSAARLIARGRPDLSAQVLTTLVIPRRLYSWLRARLK